MSKKVTFLDQTNKEKSDSKIDTIDLLIENEILPTTMPKRSPFLINIEFKNNTGENNIFKNFDFTFVNSLYDKKINNVPIIYKEIYNFIKAKSYEKIKKNKKKDKKKYAIITYSPDIAVSVPIINAVSENFGNQELKIIIFTSESRINTFKSSIPTNSPADKSDSTFEFSNSLISSLLGETNDSFFDNTVEITPNQITLIGINEEYITNEDNKELREIFGEKYLPLKKIRKHGIRKIITKYVLNEIDRPTYVIFDLAVAAFYVAPMSIRNLNGKKIINPSEIDGFNNEELDFIFGELTKLNIIGMNICNYILDDKYKDSDRAIKVTCETARLPMKKIFNMKENSFNIFNEFSKFLIFRPVKQDSSEDSGWYIFRNITENKGDPKMNNIIKNKIIDEIEDNIILFDPLNPPVLNNIYNGKYIMLDTENSEDTIFLSTTTIDEQNHKIFIKGNTDINEKILYPAEKTRMLFEMLQT